LSNYEKLTDVCRTPIDVRDFDLRIGHNALERFWHQHRLL
jgi:hypothetical protein